MIAGPAPNADAPDDADGARGGQGVDLVLSDDHHRRADLAMVRRAIREGWTIPEGARKSIPEKVNTLSQSEDPRVALGAAKTMNAMDRTNIARLQLLLNLQPIKVKHEHSGGVLIGIDDRRARLAGILGGDVRRIDAG